MTTGENGSDVVVGIDGSESALGAALWAAAVADKRSLPLTLLHATPKLDWHFVTGHTDDLPGGDGADAVLAAAEAAVHEAHPNLAVRTRAVRDTVASALGGASDSARLLVVGAGDEHLGGHVVRVSHRAHCPLVVWRRPAAIRTGKPLPVVVGVDDSEGSAHALAEAFDIAATLHAPLTVVHMWEIGAAVGMGDLGGPGNMDWTLLDLLERQQRERMDQMIAPLAAEFPGAHVAKVYKDTSPAKGLTELSRDAQLVVVGSHGRSRLADAILGSVSQSVIHHAECPVLVTR